MAVADYYYYHCLPDTQSRPCNKVEEAGDMPLDHSTGRHRELLNHACAGRRPVCAWFLEIVPMQTSVCVFVCVCVHPKAINNLWRDMDPI